MKPSWPGMKSALGPLMGSAPAPPASTSPPSKRASQAYSRAMLTSSGRCDSTSEDEPASAISAVEKKKRGKMGNATLPNVHHHW